MQDTLVFIQATLGAPVVPGGERFPNAAAASLCDKGYTTSATMYLYMQLLEHFDNREFPHFAFSDIRIFTNAPQAVCGDDPLPSDILRHPDGEAGSAMCQYLREHPEIKTVVRLLGAHPLTDIALVEETLERFKELPAEVQATCKFGPNVCALGQNIEVMSAAALIASEALARGQVEENPKAPSQLKPVPVQDRYSFFQQHVTPGVPSHFPSWEVIPHTEAVALQELGFRPCVEVIPGYVQTRSVANIDALLNWAQETGVPLGFNKIVEGWQTLGLNKDRWHWTQEGFNPNTLAEVREAMARGVTTRQGDPDVEFDLP